MMKLLIILSILICTMVVPAVSADLGFSDFLPNDAIQDLKDVGVWDLILKLVGFLAGLVIVAVVCGLIVGVAKIAFHTAGSNSVGRTDALTGMFFIIAAVVVMVLLGGLFFYIWNGLTA